MTPRFRVEDAILSGPFRLWSDASIDLTFQYLLDRPVFRDLALRGELRRRLNEVPGIDLADTAVTRRPIVKLADVPHPDGTAELLRVFDWFVETLRAGEPARMPAA